MNELIWTLVLMSWPLALIGLVGSLRRGTIWAASLLLAAVGGGVLMGALHLGELVWLPQWTGLADSMILLVLWAVFGGFARAAGGARLPGTSSFSAVISGALVGEIAATVILTANVEDRGKAARTALAASAGGFFGRLGNPGMLLLTERDPDMLFTLVPLGLLCALVVMPGGMAAPPKGRLSVTVVAGLTALGTLVSGPLAWAPVMAGCVGMAALAWPNRQAIDWQMPLRAAMIAAVVVLSATAGLPEMAALGLEEIAEPLGAWFKPALTLAGALVAMLGDTAGAGLFADAMLDRAMDLHVAGAAAALAAGITAGGLGPLLLARAFREGWLRWLIQIAIAVGWSALVL
ncbi:MAG: hypothetical protein AAFV53_38305 [Myxococcota bacterium]